MCEARSLGRQPIQTRRLIILRTIAPKALPANIVGHDQDDIGPVRGLSIHAADLQGRKDHKENQELRCFVHRHQIPRGVHGWVQCGDVLFWLTDYIAQSTIERFFKQQAANSGIRVG